ncbi:MAG: hypothetical protein PHE26_10780 [Syntrophomonadaceae bacterium]|nr:hypothetical protein [Syntrophomonadaceae bacterium]
MDHLYEIAGDIINLSSTVLEGLNHMKQRMEEGQLNETLFLFEDVLEALLSIENSIQPLTENKEGLDAAVVALKQSLEMLARAYEEKNLGKALAELSDNLIPVVEKLRSELETALKTYKES